MHLSNVPVILYLTLQNACLQFRDPILQIRYPGLQYDFLHSKGVLPRTESDSIGFRNKLDPSKALNPGRRLLLHFLELLFELGYLIVLLIELFHPLPEISLESPLEKKD